jgi:transposase
MKDAKRQSIGIDVAKKDFAVCFSVCNEQRDVKHLATKKFDNKPSGYKEFAAWITKWSTVNLPLITVMEATGVYHEQLACFISDKGVSLSVVLAKRAKDFSKTLQIKTTNDKISSQYLAIMGLEKKLDLWKKPEKVYIDLKQFTREREQLMGLRTEVKNHIHAEQSGAWPNAKTLKRLKDQLALLNKQVKEIVKDVDDVLTKNPSVKEKIDLATSIPGVGVLTAATIAAETNGFNQIRNKRQLVSYAGYDVIQHTSGTSINTKARISKRGNRHIRKAMHMPALSAIRHNEHDKSTFIRIVTRTSIKMKGVVAIQRKLLVLIYTLWKNNTSFDPAFEEKKQGQSKTALDELDLVRS